MIDSRLREFCKDRSGAAIIFAALMMPVFVGSLGLGAETGYRYYNQRLLQHAADVSAHAGAVRKYKGDEKPAIDAAAVNVATGSGFMPAVGIPTVNIPPTSGAFIGDPSAVEVILVETRPRLFSSIFSAAPVEIGARAVAAVTAEGSSGCILALSETASPGVTVQGSPDVTLSGCSVAANSREPDAFSIPNRLNDPMSVGCISTVGGVSTHSDTVLQTDCDSVMENAPPVQDPYYWVQEPDLASIPCTPRSKQVDDDVTLSDLEHPNGTVIGVRCYPNGFDAKDGIHLAPGLYIISGGKMTVNGLLEGSGVTFYFTGSAEMNIGSTATLKLSAPTDDNHPYGENHPYKGILFFGSRSYPVKPVDHTIQGTASSELTGAIYMPASEVKFSGNSASSSGCTQLIADTVILTGNSELSSDCEDDGTTPFVVGQLIAVVE